MYDGWPIPNLVVYIFRLLWFRLVALRKIRNNFILSSFTVIFMYFHKILQRNMFLLFFIFNRSKTKVQTKQSGLKKASNVQQYHIWCPSFQFLFSLSITGCLDIRWFDIRSNLHVFKPVLLQL